MTSMPPGHPRALHWLLNILTVGFVLLALMFLFVWLTPHSGLSRMLDSLAATRSANGSVTHPTQAGVNAVIARLPLASRELAVTGGSAYDQWDRRLSAHFAHRSRDSL